MFVTRWRCKWNVKDILNGMIDSMGEEKGIEIVPNEIEDIGDKQ